MIRRIVFSEQVLKEDLPSIDIAKRRNILIAIRKKLTADPVYFGKPLRRELRGLWSLRVDEWRVIYSIKNRILTVVVVNVGKRKDDQVYRDAVRRLKP